jgi:hypothetical protein
MAAVFDYIVGTAILAAMLTAEKICEWRNDRE